MHSVITKPLHDIPFPRSSTILWMESLPDYCIFGVHFFWCQNNLIQFHIWTIGESTLKIWSMYRPCRSKCKSCSCFSSVNLKKTTEFLHLWWIRTKIAFFCEWFPSFFTATWKRSTETIAIALRCWPSKAAAAATAVKSVEGIEPSNEQTNYFVPATHIPYNSVLDTFCFCLYSCCNCQTRAE